MAGKTRRRPRSGTSLSGEVKLLCGCQAVLSFGLGLAFPFIAIYLHGERGLSMTWVGAWLSLTVLVTAFSQWLGGILSDRYGRGQIMIPALWSRAATSLAIAYAIRSEWALGALLSAHVLATFLSHFFEPAARGWIADHTGARQRYRAFGLQRMAAYGGFALGPALGGLVADSSYFLIFTFCAAVCGFCALGATILLRGEAPPKGGTRWRESLSLDAGLDWNFLRLCGFYALLSVAMAQLVVPLSIYAKEIVGLKESQVGLLLSLNGLLIVLFQMPVVHLFSGVRLTAAISLGALMYALGYAWVGWAGGLGGLAGAVAVVTAGEILVPSAVHALAANMSPDKERGRFLGVLGLSRQLGSAIGPLAGCAGLELAVAVGLPGHWLGVSVLALIAAAGFLSMGGRLLPDEEGLVDDLLEGGETDSPQIG